MGSKSECMWTCFGDYAPFGNIGAAIFLIFTGSFKFFFVSFPPDFSVFLKIHFMKLRFGYFTNIYPFITHGKHYCTCYCHLRTPQPP